MQENNNCENHGKDENQNGLTCQSWTVDFSDNTEMSLNTEPRVKSSQVNVICFALNHSYSLKVIYRPYIYMMNIYDESDWC